MPEDPAWWNDLGPRFYAAIRVAGSHGRMTYDELDAVMPDKNYTSEQIENLLEYLGRMGIELVEVEH